MSEKLKNCPFCGCGEAEAICLGGLWKVKCSNCDASTCLCAHERIAVKEWGDRAEATEVISLVEKLGEIQKEYDDRKKHGGVVNQIWVDQALRDALSEYREARCK